MNNVSIENWAALRGILLTAIGDLVGRADVDDPKSAITEIARAIDVLSMLGHPLAGIEHMGVRQ